MSEWATQIAHMCKQWLTARCRKRFGKITKTLEKTFPEKRQLHGFVGRQKSITYRRHDFIYCKTKFVRGRSLEYSSSFHRTYITKPTAQIATSFAVLCERIRYLSGAMGHQHPVYLSAAAF
jgi:hypothetical protein